MAMRL
jgi:hypothetical protein